MGRPSNRHHRRSQILEAFAQVLAEHGYAGATIAAVAAEAGVAPGLIHHHFKNKDELLAALLDSLIARFRSRARTYEEDTADPLDAYVDGALKLDERADLVAARCWVGLLAEAVRSPSLFQRVRRLVDAEISEITRRSSNMSEQNAGAVLAFIVGSLVLGAFAPRKTAGFASPALRLFIDAVRGAA